MEHNIEADIEKLTNTSIPFNTPLIEALTNSIQAGATDIKVEFDVEFTPTKSYPVINGYKITDNC